MADAVRASMSIPFFFTGDNHQPHQRADIHTARRRATVELPDRLPRPHRRPAAALADLRSHPAAQPARRRRQGHPAAPDCRNHAPCTFSEGIIATILVGRDQAYRNQPWVSARTIPVDSTSVGVVDFGITSAETQALYTTGYQAAQTFLQGWNWQDYLKRFR